MGLRSCFQPGQGSTRETGEESVSMEAEKCHSTVLRIEHQTRCEHLVENWCRPFAVQQQKEMQK
jgi:hypothetical protein